MDQCVSFGDDFDISFNRRKTVCMAITANNYVMLNHPSLLLRDVPLTFVTSFKYLGFHINSSFNDDDDIRRQMRSFYFRSNSHSYL